jgi:aminoglycoside 6'-N-acetyltransferase I
MDATIRQLTKQDKTEWFKMRKGIWPEAPDEFLTYDMDDILNNRQYSVWMVFIGGQPAGMVEASIREIGEGCETSPVGYIEAWFVDESLRARGLGGKLLKTAEEWARQKGCTEMASDTWLDNEKAISAHLKNGYEEVERLVHFVKQI